MTSKVRSSQWTGTYFPYPDRQIEPLGRSDPGSDVIPSAVPRSLQTYGVVVDTTVPDLFQVPYLFGVPTPFTGQQKPRKDQNRYQLLTTPPPIVRRVERGRGTERPGFTLAGSPGGYDWRRQKSNGADQAPPHDRPPQRA
jgi:hypothetical protein